MKKCPFVVKLLSSTLAATMLLSPLVSVYAAVPTTDTYADVPFVKAANGDLYLTQDFQDQSTYWLDTAETTELPTIVASEETPSTSTLPTSSDAVSSENSSSSSAVSSEAESASSTNVASSSSSTGSASSSSVQSQSSSIVESQTDTTSEELATPSLLSQAPAQTVQGFVERLYSLVMGREGDATGVAFWTNGLKDGTFTAATTLLYFFQSPEFSAKNVSDGEYLEILYLTMMDRTYDQTGYNYWMETLDNGLSRDFVLHNFLVLPEFSTICADFGVNRGDFALTQNRDQNVAITTFVSGFYKNCLGRNADADGINAWTGWLLEKSQTGGSIAEFFFNSPEYLAKNVSDAEFLETAYRTILGRAIDESGRSYWSSLLTEGYSRNYILNQMVSSPEFKNACDKAGIAVGSVKVESRDENVAISNFVKRTFQTILNRPIDTDGLNFYTQQLANGQSALTYFSQLFGSAEFANRHLNNTETVHVIYQAMLNRDADPSGLSNNVNALDRMVSPLYIVRSVGLSSEFKTVCDRVGISVGTLTLTEGRDQNIDVTDVAVNAYRSLLNREPDIAGLNHLASSLNGKNAESVLDTLYGFTTSAEFKARNLDSRAYIVAIFTALCGRTPTDAEISSWLSLLTPDNDNNRKVVFYLLGNSSTCSAYLGPKLGISTFNTQEKGIDVSAHQKVVDWAQVAADGYTFAIIRAVSSSNTSSSPVIDPYFYQNVRGARAAGLKVGVYIYSYAKTTQYVTEEVNTALSAVRAMEKEGYRFEYPIVLDMEEFKTAGPNWTEIARTGLVLIDQQGYYPCLYSYANAFKNGTFNMTTLAGYDLWVAHHDVGAMSYPGAIWQYTSKGAVRGVSGNCDLNISYRDFAAIIRASRKNNL